MIILIIESVIFLAIVNTSNSFIQKSFCKSYQFSPLQAFRKIDVGTKDGPNNFGKDLVDHELLSAKDEFQLSRQFKLGLQVKVQRDRMSKELGRPVNDDELAVALGLSSKEHINILIDRGKESKRILVKSNMRLVFHLTKYYKTRGLAYPDLIQEGTFGLMKAVDKYDPEKGFRFSTYASWWIKQAVSRAIAEKSRLVRVPVHIHDLMVSMSRIEKIFISQNHRSPSPKELALQLALPLRKVELLVKCSKELGTTDSDVFQFPKTGTQVEVQVKDRLVSTVSEPAIVNDQICVRTELRRMMRTLSEREAQIMEMRFGLGDGTQKSLEDCSKHFCVTRERIRQIEARALSKMRTPSKTTGMFISCDN